jgi:NADH-quinone oxidoreductase subunit C
MLTLKEIHERLKEPLGEAILEQVEEALDPYLKVDPKAMGRVGAHLKNDPELAFNFLASISSVDQKETLAAVYHLEAVDLQTGRILHKLILKVEVPRDKPVVASVAGVWSTANWQERECYDLMGLVFEGHPDPRRILTDDDWVGHPLRKDYEFPKTYRGIDLT